MNGENSIVLDMASVRPEDLSLEALMHEIGLQKRPHRFLRKMMTALEQKRQKKGLGWSRSWNKYGMNNFRTHICDAQTDQGYLSPVFKCLREHASGLEPQYAEYIESLLSDESLMAFTFYHNSEHDGDQYEGITFSLGRKVAEDRTKRDRIDVVFEDKRVDGAVDGIVDRVRIYTCPWSSYSSKEFHLDELVSAGSPNAQLQGLYKHLVSYYHLWKQEDDRLWNHWSIRYIDYFGPRSFIPVNSSFT